MGVIVIFMRSGGVLFTVIKYRQWFLYKSDSCTFGAALGDDMSHIDKILGPGKAFRG